MRALHLAMYLYLVFGSLVPLAGQAQGNARNGQYVSQAAGCIGCHTDNRPGAVPFAGGRALATPFGIFYGPNITPHRETGIGAWSLDEFRNALRRGERPDGTHYFPAFPYASFAAMTDTDIQDLWAYMRSLPPSNLANRAHDLRFPFGWRFLVAGWKWLFFKPRVQAAAAATGPLARGAYLVGALGHCGECHTPRNLLGGPKAGSFLAGARIAEGRVPNLTPTNLKKWSDGDLKEYLVSGMTADGDVAGEPMGEVITNTTSKLTGDDLSAMVAYLRSLNPLPDASK